MIYDQIFFWGLCRPMINGMSMFSSCIYSEETLKRICCCLHTAALLSDQLFPHSI